MQCNGFVLPFSAYSQLTNSFRSRQAAPLATPTTETFQFLGFGAARGAPPVGSGLSRIPQVRVACLLYPGPFGLHSPFVARRLLRDGLLSHTRVLAVLALRVWVPCETDPF